LGVEPIQVKAKRVGFLDCDCVLSVSSMDNEAEGYRGLAQHGGPPGWLEESGTAGGFQVMDGPCSPALTVHKTPP